MAVVNLKQELWMATIVTLLEKASTAMATSNTNIVRGKGADTYHIIGTAEVTTQDTPAVGTAITYSEVSDTNTDFLHNLDKTFGIVIPDRDKLESMSGWEALYSQRGGYQLRNDFDVAALGDHATWTDATGVPTTVGTDASGIPDFYSSIAEQLDSADLPPEGRYVIVNPNVIQATRLWLAAKGTVLGDQVSINGFVTRIFGMDVLMSRNLTTVTTTVHGRAGVYGEGVAANVLGVQEIEMLRDKDEWNSYIRGRLIAGYKTYAAARVFDVSFEDQVLA